MLPGHVPVVDSRPARFWTAAAALALLGAVATGAAGIASAVAASRPIGEGELFLEEASGAAADLESRLAEGAEPAVALRHIRNDLEVEAVSLLDEAGRVVESTSGPFVGADVVGGFLREAVESGAFAAVATSLPVAVEIDGVLAHPPGEILYEVVHPAGAQRSLLLAYDMSELSARRRPDVPSPDAPWLFGASVVFGVAAVGLVIARNRAAVRYREIGLRAAFLEHHSAELAEKNRLLDDARREAEQALALAEEKSRIRSEFVLMINHELRTPLTAVVTGSRLLAAGVGDAERAEILSEIVAGAERLERMLARMLAVARVENRGLFLETAPVPLDDVLDRVESVAGGVERAVAPDVIVRTDATTLPEIVGILAENARTHGATRVRVRAEHELGFDPLVEVGDRPEPHIVIAVDDDGPGIDPAFLPRAFEKFEKSSRSPGTGLGLYLVHMMAAAIGASVAVTTSPSGTTVAVLVPLAGSRLALS